MAAMISEDQSRIASRLERLAKRCAAVYWVRGAVYGFVAALILAAILETLSARGLVALPLAPWSLGVLLAPGTLLGLLLGWSRAPSVGLCLHKLDRANGFPDTLLLGYEFGRESDSLEAQQKGEDGFRAHLWAEVRQALDRVRGDTMTPWGAKLMAAWLVVSVSLFGAAGTLATVGPSGLPARAMGAWVLEKPISVRASASLTSREDRELVTDLLEEIRLGLEHAEDGTESRAVLESLSEVARALQAEELAPSEALSRLERLKAKVSSSDLAVKEAEKAQEQDRVMKGLVEQAKKELQAASKKGSLEGEQSDSALINSLAEWALTLAERDPEAFESLAKRLARTLDGRALSRLKDRHSALGKKLERMARKLGSDPKKARRLKKLQSQLERLSKDIASKESKPASPSVERLRRALAPEKDKATSQAQKASGSSSEKSADSKLQKKVEQGSKSKGSNQASKAKKVRSALKGLSGEMTKEKQMQRVRKRLEKTTSRVRREVSTRRAAERMRKFNKKSSGRSGPRRLSRSSASSSRASARNGASTTSGRSSADGVQPGTGHEQSSQAGRKSERVDAEYQDSIVSNEGKSGSYLRKEYKGSSSLGKGSVTGKKFDLDQELDDEVLKARIPSRYRETVRTYFRLLPELFSD